MHERPGAAVHERTDAAVHERTGAAVSQRAGKEALADLMSTAEISVPG